MSIIFYWDVTGCICRTWFVRETNKSWKLLGRVAFMVDRANWLRWYSGQSQTTNTAILNYFLFLFFLVEKSRKMNTDAIYLSPTIFDINFLLVFIAEVIFFVFAYFENQLHSHLIFRWKLNFLLFFE